MKKTIILFLILAFNTLSAKTIYVVSAPPYKGLENGISWNSAYSSIKMALKDAKAGDQIWIRNGRYLEAFIKVPSGVSIYGGFQGNEKNLSDRKLLFRNPNQTFKKYPETQIIAYDALNKKQVSNVFILDQSENVLIDGVYVTGTISHLGQNNEVPDEYHKYYGVGGGIHMFASKNITIKNCVFYENKAVSGGAIFANASNHIQFINCSFIKNTAQDDGGGINLWCSNQVEFVNCLIADNIAEDMGGGAGNGGGISIVQCEPSAVSKDVFKFINCTVTNNKVTNPNGIHGLCVVNGYANIYIYNSIFMANGYNAFEPVTYNDIAPSNQSSDIGYGTIKEIQNSIIGSSEINTEKPFENVLKSDQKFNKTLQSIFGNYYTIGNNSIAINKGKNTYNTENLDISLQRRVRNGTIDIGCFEYQSGDIVANSILEKDKIMIENLQEGETINVENYIQDFGLENEYSYKFYANKKDALDRKNEVGNVILFDEIKAKNNLDVPMYKNCFIGFTKGKQYEIGEILIDISNYLPKEITINYQDETTQPNGSLKQAFWEKVNLKNNENIQFYSTIEEAQKGYNPLADDYKWLAPKTIFGKLLVGNKSKIITIHGEQIEMATILIANDFDIQNHIERMQKYQKTKPNILQDKIVVSQSEKDKGIFLEIISTKTKGVISLLHNDNFIEIIDLNNLNNKKNLIPYSVANYTTYYFITHEDAPHNQEPYQVKLTDHTGKLLYDKEHTLNTDQNIVFVLETKN